MPRISALSTGTPASTSDIPLNVGSTTVRANVQTILATPLSAQGNMTYADSSVQTTRLASPSSGAVLTYSSASSIPAWSIITSGGILTGAAAGTPTWLAAPSSGSVLTFSSASSIPAWITGTSGGVLTANAVGVPSFLAPPTSGSVLTFSSASSIPAWSVAARGGVLTGGANSDIAWLASPTSGSVLTFSTASSIPAWIQASSGATLIASSIGVPTWLAIGSSGQILQTTGGSPAWVNTTAVLAETLTAAGDMLIRSTAGIVALAQPSSGAVLTFSTVNGTSRPLWSVPTSGAVLVASSLGVPVWRAIGTSGQILESTGGTPTWTTPAAGGSSEYDLPAQVWFPTGDIASSHESAQLAISQSTASVPSPRRLVWLFDGSTNEHIVTQFKVPNTFTASSAPTLAIYYYSVTANATSGVAWGTRIAASSDGQATINQTYTANNVTTFTGGTSGVIDVAVVSLTSNESMSSADFITLELFRSPTNGGDLTDGDVAVLGCVFRWG